MIWLCSGVCQPKSSILNDLWMRLNYPPEPLADPGILVNSKLTNITYSAFYFGTYSTGRQVPLYKRGESTLISHHDCMKVSEEASGLLLQSLMWVSVIWHEPAHSHTYKTHTYKTFLCFDHINHQHEYSTE